jgi:para-aminobenzoate synthetase component 1
VDIAYRRHVEELPPELSEGSLSVALDRLRHHHRPVLLEAPGGGPARHELLAFDPVRDVTWAAGADLGALSDVLAGFTARGGDAPPPFFAGGFLGALAYDLGVVGERLELPDEPWGQPLVVGGLYTDYLVRDVERDRTWLALGEREDGPSVATRRRLVRDALADATPRRERAPRALGELVRHTPPAEHRRRVAAVRELIAAGELYQANLAHRFTRDVEGDPVDLYLRLRAANPGPYNAFLRWEDGAVLSASPELLLALDPACGEARTRPIKGTAPRGATPAEDERRAADLLASAKDRAELAMIVDLERNDLGRVATPGGVRVEDFPRLESYASVHHMTADVVATPRPDVSAHDVLAALFPGGSITGAPKLRSMEAIAALEGEGRGFFTGSLGLLDLAGRAHFNILIRTLLWRPRPELGELGGEVSFRVGGGITWGSDPAAEDAETLDKGAALEAALESRDGRSLGG